MANSQQNTPETRSSILLAELHSLAGHDCVLELLLQDGGRPTADDYIVSQWMGEDPGEIEPEDAHIIALLRQLETAD